jgi:hypothetical protein
MSYFTCICSSRRNAYSIYFCFCATLATTSGVLVEFYISEALLYRTLLAPLLKIAWIPYKAQNSLFPQAAHLLRSWIRIPLEAWIFVCCERRVLSGRGLCDELITRPEETYRLCCGVVCDLETSRIGVPYIYDISSLRVNDLTLILLTWRKSWANNASK